MYVSVTGLKTKGFVGIFRFWMLAIPSFRAAQKADGCLFCETKTVNGYHHTFTVWTDKTAMMKYRASPVHLKAMKVFSQIAYGKVYGYEADNIPTWNEALEAFNDHARDV
ncbi:MAG: hypothetical protein AB8B49_02040 [Nitratireductor sp.]